MAKTRRSYTGGAASTTTGSSIASSGTTSFTIAAYTGWPYGSAPFHVVVEPGTSNEEKILVTRTGATDTTINIYATPNVAANRGVDGTTAFAHNSASTVYPVFTATDADEANELASTLTTQGDILIHGASTFGRVGIGTAAQVLRVNSGATSPEWGQVATAGIADDAITAAKIATGAVGADEIAANAVGASELADDAVDTAAIVNLAVTTGKINDLAITTGKLADSSVTSAKIADGTIVDADINASAAITKTKISGTAITAADTGTVTSTMILDGTIATADIADSAITVAKLGLIELKLRRAATQAFSGSTGGYVSWDTEDADASGFISATSASITVPSGLTGLYNIGYLISSDVTSNTTYAYIELNGVEVGTNSTPRVTTTKTFDGKSLYLEATDVIKLYFYPGASGKNITGRLWMTRIMD
jgi:hypothetical protein